MELEACDVERGAGGTILVRVHSSLEGGSPLPDAVFTFRQGDPQYEYWLRQLMERENSQFA